MSFPGHVHAFRMINHSQHHTGNSLKWMERCKCGVLIAVEAFYGIGNDVKPRVTKSWFHRDGSPMGVKEMKNSSIKHTVIDETQSEENPAA